MKTIVKNGRKYLFDKMTQELRNVPSIKTKSNVYRFIPRSTTEYADVVRSMN